VSFLELKGVHFLLTYKCDLECDHCFVWGEPKAKGTFTLSQINNILDEARKLKTVNYASIEGGEPFLFYPIMVKAVEEAVNCGFRVEILSNCYWATSAEDAVEWLRPLARANVELSPSSDFYHAESWENELVRNAVRAARALGMKVGINAIKYPKTKIPCPAEIEGARVDLSELMYKGRAASKLAEEAEEKNRWQQFTKCPYENLENPERVHVDPYGNVHVCQGISIGNAWRVPFLNIVREYSPNGNPILEPLAHGGPVALVEKFSLTHREVYADACHLCYEARCMLRKEFTDTLCPDQMYGEEQQ
jgi:MoaA/NifB/PqqE/SkfB family radical SAM enzyme